MLRLVVLVLLLANGLFFAWSSGALQALGLGPVAATEPQRVVEQILPDAVRIDGVEEGRAP